MSSFLLRVDRFCQELPLPTYIVALCPKSNSTHSEKQQQTDKRTKKLGTSFELYRSTPQSLSTLLSVSLLKCTPHGQPALQACFEI